MRGPLIVLSGAGLVVLVGLGYVIFVRRQAGNTRSQAPGNVSAAVQEIKSSPLPTRETDARGNPIAEDELKSRREYKLGRALSQCLSQGCQVFFGTVRDIGAAEKKAEEPDEWAVFYRKLTITPDEWLWGDRQQLGPTVELMYAAKPQVFKSAPGPWSVWEGVNIKVNEEIFLALWDAQARKNRSEEIALVVSDKTLATRLSDTVKIHVSLKQSGEEMERVLKSLTDNSDSVVAGYLVVYLTSAQAQGDVDRAALNLSSLLSVKRLPASAVDDVARMLTSDFPRLSTETRHTAAKALVATAAGDGLDQATPAISSLISLSDSKLLDLKSIASGAQRMKLIANYLAAVSQGRIDKADVEF